MFTELDYIIGMIFGMVMLLCSFGFMAWIIWLRYKMWEREQ